MPVQKVSTVYASLKALDNAVDQLKEAMRGEAPDDNVHHKYAQTPEDFQRDFRHITPEQLDNEIAKVRSVLTQLSKKLKKEDKSVQY